MPEEPTAPENLDPQVQQPEPADGGQACPGPHTVITPEQPAPEPGPEKEIEPEKEVEPETPAEAPGPCEDPKQNPPSGNDVGCCPG